MQTTNQLYQPQNLPARLTLPVEVEFGNPRSKDCQWLGVCRVHTFSAAGPPCTCGFRVKALLWTWEGVGVEFAFQKKSMNAATLEKHFGSGFFHILEAYALSEEVLEAIGSEGFTIGPGAYPVREDGGWLKVVFA